MGYKKRFFGLFETNISLDLVKKGFAQVYRGRLAEYGHIQEMLEQAEVESK